MGIAKRHGKGLVTEEFLNRCNIHSCHYEMAREGMTEIMKVEVLNAITSQRAPARSL